MNERKHYLDNIRWITLCVVIIYHVFYIFNSSGVISNINATGIKQLDVFCVFVYPWIMCLLFPSLIGIFVYGWISGYITN